MARSSPPLAISLDFLADQRTLPGICAGGMIDAADRRNAF